MPKPKPWLDVNDYIDYREPNTDRSTWTRSNPWSFGASTFKVDGWPDKQFDESKCPVCGGSGRYWQTRDDSKGRRRGIKRNVPCPENCEYTIKW